MPLALPHSGAVEKGGIIEPSAFLPETLKFIFSKTRKLYSKQKTHTQILSPWDIPTAISPMTGISDKHFHGK
jgi:hypothetical protein